MRLSCLCGFDQRFFNGSLLERTLLIKLFHSVGTRLPFLFLLCVVIPPLATAADGVSSAAQWQQALDHVSRTQAEKLRQLDELLLAEILQQLPPSGERAGTGRRLELLSWQTVLTKEIALLQKGKPPEPASVSDSKRWFFQAADTMEWHLNGTRNVKGFTITNGVLSLLLMQEGVPPRPAVSGICHAAGVLSHDRSDHSRTYYIVSPDFRLAHCVIASRLLTGHLLRGEAAVPPPTLPARATPAQPAPSEDIIEFMLAKRLELLASQARERLRTLEHFQDPATLGDELFSRRLTEAQSEIGYLDGHDPHSAAISDAETAESFTKRTAGLSWRIPDGGEIEHLRFDGVGFQALDGAGAVRSNLSAKVFWPGLFRVLDSKNQPLVLWIARDLSQILVFRSRGEFTGQRVK